MITRKAWGTITRRSALAAPQPERGGRLVLSLGDRQDAGAHDLGDEGRRVDRKREEDRQEFGPDLESRRKVERAELREVERRREAVAAKTTERHPTIRPRAGRASPGRGPVARWRAAKTRDSTIVAMMPTTNAQKVAAAAGSKIASVSAGRGSR